MEGPGVGEGRGDGKGRGETQHLPSPSFPLGCLAGTFSVLAAPSPSGLDPVAVAVAAAACACACALTQVPSAMAACGSGPLVLCWAP